MLLNVVEGPIPEELGTLELTEVDLSDNYFIGKQAAVMGTTRKQFGREFESRKGFLSSFLHVALFMKHTKRSSLKPRLRSCTEFSREFA